ncbi:hypothetical protein BXY66_1254 [Shimia isoporae]|uniref:Uncharacterized protein n=1 Tax=Shimia isoporae TaxID=647720 RepID=A0A4R1NN41_9RHOB|nr:hypothetical protein [Shimia isoporae]TCL09209.1 hypothetical protein BXY66_1254 [Shimia isoporae]
MKTVKDLLLALLNATLILVALCLFLLWQVSRSGERIAASFAQSLTQLNPVEQSVDGLREEVVTLRNDLRSLTEGSAELSEAAVARFEVGASRLDRALSNIEGEMAKLAATPENLTDYAIDRTAERVSKELQALMQCRQPDA